MKNHDSDSEYIERLRHNIAKFNRFRWIIVAIYILFAICAIALGIVAINFARSLPGMGWGFATGVSIGFSMGIILVSTIHHLLMLLTMNDRKTHLLLRYYDTVREIELSLSDKVGEQMTAFIDSKK